MAKTQTDGRFAYTDLFAYAKEGKYPKGFSKEDKRALRKRAQFFRAKEAALYYVGGKPCPGRCNCIQTVR